MYFPRLGPNVLNAVLLIDTSSVLLNCIVYCDPERFFFRRRLRKRYLGPVYMKVGDPR